MRTLDRALSILRLLSEAPAQGMRLSEIARRTGMSKATSHRLLRALAVEGLVAGHSIIDGYALGPELMILGRAAESKSLDVRGLARPTVERLAHDTGDSIFLQVRSGRYCICIDRVLGNFPIKAFTIEIGARRPLGIGGGSLALLSALEDDEIDLILDQNGPELAAVSKAVAPAALRHQIQRTRNLGYAIALRHVHSRICSIGIAIGPTGRAPIGAISVSAISERFSKSRIDAIIEILLNHTKALTDELDRHKIATLARGF